MHMAPDLVAPVPENTNEQTKPELKIVVSNTAAAGCRAGAAAGQGAGDLPFRRS